MSRPKLIFTQPGFTGQSCELPEGRTTVGRSSKSNLVIRDDTVSGDHCEILVSWSEVIVREHGSRNGTWVGGRRVTGQQPAYPGEVIRFGRVEARLELPETAEPDVAEDTRFILRQQASWQDPTDPAPELHAVVDAPGAGGSLETRSDGTLILPRPNEAIAQTPGSPPVPVGPSRPPLSRRRSPGWLVPILVAAAAIGLLLLFRG